VARDPVSGFVSGFQRGKFFRRAACHRLKLSEGLERINEHIPFRYYQGSCCGRSRGFMTPRKTPKRIG
jgi:hypothetical protein